MYFFLFWLEVEFNEGIDEIMGIRAVAAPRRVHSKLIASLSPPCALPPRCWPIDHLTHEPTDQVRFGPLGIHAAPAAAGNKFIWGLLTCQQIRLSSFN